MMSLLALSGFYLFSKDSLWSLYYKIDIYPCSIPGETQKAFDIWVNNTGHQLLVPSKYVDQEPMYGEIYRHYDPSRFKKMLILGAGGGRDTAYHLARGEAEIDAVEIEPALMEYGRTLHPEKPYTDSRVRIHVNDARTFMKQCRDKYDCIIFALPDSLVLSSSYANLRLESYLFTLESFREARRLLKDDGILVLYNYFRKPWLIDKIASMLDEAFGYPPVIFRYANTMTCFITGPGSMEMGMNSSSFGKFPSATDDWPFLYLKKPSFPSIYISMAISIIVITMVLSFAVMRKEHFAFNPAFFFLGSAFLLLETKCVVNFCLLFGSTWIVNSVVFFAVLLLVLLAVCLTEKFPVKNRIFLYGILMTSIVVQFLVPLKTFLELPVAMQYTIAPLFYFLPIFFSNLVFAHSFRDAREATAAYTSNMLGGILGGITEYFAMLTGYSMLLIVVLVFYGAAIFFFVKSKR
jgi:SAM-dependent methyltransferase